MQSPQLILVLMSVLFTVACKKNEQKTCIPLFGVYPAWDAGALAVDAIPWPRLTHLAVVFIVPQKDGGLITHEVDQVLQHISQSRQAQGKKIVVSVGGAQGYGDAFQVITADKEKQKKFVGAVVKYAVKHNLDGIDIDWEYWTKQDVHQEGGNDPLESWRLVGLMADLRAALPPAMQLSVSVFPGYWKGEQYLPELQLFVDYVVLMAFDATGQWQDSAIDHHASYSVFRKSAEFLLDRGFKKEKIIIAAPLYGIEFMDGKNATVNYHDYKQIVAMGNENIATINTGRRGNIFYETPALIQKKSQYIVDQGFAGMVFFELTQDTASPATSLLAASNNIISPEFCEYP